MSQKRERSINFTKEETDLLLELIDENKHIVENKKSDAVTWAEKENCWKEIEVSFNSVSGITYRTSKNLKLRYESIKRETRKKSATHRIDVNAAPPLTCFEEKVKMILLSVDGMDTSFGIDSERLAERLVTLEPYNTPLQMDYSIIKVENPESENTNELNTEYDNTSTNESHGILNENQVTVDIAEHSESDMKCSQWKPKILKCKKRPILCKPKLLRSYERVADSKLEIIDLQKQILQEELVHKRKKWAFEEQEREQQRKRWAFEKEEQEHKRQLWTLEKGWSQKPS